MAAKRSNRRKHYGSVARMRILRVSQTLETQKTLRIRSDSANFEGQPNVRITENTTDAQRECEFRGTAKRSNHRKHYGCTARVQILRDSQAFESQKTLRIRSESANFEGQPNAGIRENTRIPQRGCEFRDPAKRSNRRKRLGTAARMQF